MIMRWGDASAWLHASRKGRRRSCTQSINHTKTSLSLYIYIITAHFIDGGIIHHMRRHTVDSTPPTHQRQHSVRHYSSTARRGVHPYKGYEPPTVRRRLTLFTKNMSGVNDRRRTVAQPGAPSCMNERRYPFGRPTQQRGCGVACAATMPSSHRSKTTKLQQCSSSRDHTLKRHTIYYHLGVRQLNYPPNMMAWPQSASNTAAQTKGFEPTQRNYSSHYQSSPCAGTGNNSELCAYRWRHPKITSYSSVGASL